MKLVLWRENWLHLLFLLWAFSSGLTSLSASSVKWANTSAYSVKVLWRYNYLRFRDISPKLGCRRGFVRTGVDGERNEIGAGWFPEWFIVSCQHGLSKLAFLLQVWCDGAVYGETLYKSCKYLMSTGNINLCSTCGCLLNLAPSPSTVLNTNLVLQMEIFHS